MYPSLPVLRTFFSIVLAFAIFATPVTAGSSAQNLPEDLVRVLPDGLHMLAVAPSLDSLNEALEPWAYLRDSPEDKPFDAKAWLQEILGDDALLINPQKPIALAVTAGNVMMGEQVIFTLAVYLDCDTDQSDSLILSYSDMEGEVYPRLRQGHYVAFSDATTLIPGTGTAPILQDIPRGSLVISMDLEKFFTDYRALIEMGLGMASMSMTTAPDDSTATPPPMSAQELSAATQFLMALMDSGRRYDLVFENAKDQLLLESNLTIIPESPLSPGPQPAFDEALQLTRFLPKNAAFITAQAWSFGPLLDLYKDYYTASISKLAEAMNPNVGNDFVTWYEEISKNITMYELPMAASLNLTSDGLNTNTVIKCNDAEIRFAEMVNMVESIPEALGYSFKALPEMKAGGVIIKSWEIDHDSAIIMETMSASMGPQTEEDTAFQTELSDILYEKLIPQFMVASQGDYLFLSASNNTKSLESMIKATKMRRGGLDKFTARAAKQGGDDIRQLQVIDARALLTWSTELFEEIAQQAGNMDKDDNFPNLDGKPIILSTTTSASTDGYRSNLMIKTNDLNELLETIMNLVEFMDELEEDDQ